MPTSLKQWKTNRENARKSTGPRSDVGKALAAMNAVRHGLYSAEPIIDSPHLKERREEFDTLLAGLLTDLNPRGTFQYQLVAKIALCFWRQRRLINAETARISEELDTDSVFPDLFYGKVTDDLVQNTPELINRVHARSIPDGKFADNLLRMEYRFDRQLIQCYTLLNSLKKADRESGEESYDLPAAETPPDTAKRGNEPNSPQPPAPPNDSPHHPADPLAIFEQSFAHPCQRETKPNPDQPAQSQPSTPQRPAETPNDTIKKRGNEPKSSQSTPPHPPESASDPIKKRGNEPNSPQPTPQRHPESASDSIKKRGNEPNFPQPTPPQPSTTTRHSPTIDFRHITAPHTVVGG